MNAIVAVDRNWGIGKDGALLYSLTRDMRHFRFLTTGGTVLMGRRTLDSLPGGKPLPQRRNVVLSTVRDEIPGAEVVHTMEELRLAAQGEDPDRVFVIGGGSVYAALLPYCTHALVTKVDAVSDADTFFPNLDKLPGWEIAKVSDSICDDDVTYHFFDYVNRNLK